MTDQPILWELCRGKTCLVRTYWPSSWTTPWPNQPVEPPWQMYRDGVLVAHAVVGTEDDQPVLLIELFENL